MASTINIIGAPSSAGAYAPGQEKAPSAFRSHGLIRALQQSGLSVRDLGDVAGFRWRPELSRPDAMNLDAVARTATLVAQQVAEALKADNAVLILGGDCTVEIGTVAGAQQDGKSIGVVYIDFDVDLNAPAKSDGALDWTVAAHLLGLPGTAPELSKLGQQTPMLQPADILFFGPNESEITPHEKDIMRDLSIACIPLDAVKENPVLAAEKAKQWSARFDRLLVHLDTDVLSYIHFPIAENVRRSNGLTLPELTQALQVLTHAPNWRTLTITEVNPDHAPDEKAIFRDIIDALSLSIRP